MFKRFQNRALKLSEDQAEKLEQVEKLVKEKTKQFEIEEDYSSIKLVLSSELEMYSKFSFTSQHKINIDIMEYIVQQAKHIHISYQLIILVELLDGKNEVEAIRILDKMFKRNIMNSLVDCSHELKRNLKLIFSMFLFGSIAMSLSIIISNFLNIFAVRELIVITSWVFIWRGVEAYFFGRKRLKDQKLKLLQLYTAEFEMYD